jgi:acyl carrier protein
MKRLAGILDGQPGALTEASTLEQIGWDSMSELSFIALADKELATRVSPSAVEECRTVGDLVALVRPSLEP